MANQQHELQALLRSSSRNWTLGTLALTFPLFVLAPWIIALSGPQFSASLELLYMLGVGLVVASLWGPVVPAMQTIGDERVFLRIQLSTLAAQFVCSFALVLHWGALGATIGQSLALCLRGYLIARWFKRHKNLEIGVLSLGHR